MRSAWLMQMWKRDKDMGWGEDQSVRSRSVTNTNWQSGIKATLLRWRHQAKHVCGSNSMKRATPRGSLSNTPTAKKKQWIIAVADTFMAAKTTVYELTENRFTVRKIGHNTAGLHSSCSEHKEHKAQCRLPFLLPCRLVVWHFYTSR